MIEREKALDDIARLAGGAISALSGLSAQVKDEIRARLDEYAARMDLVPREDFQRLEAMLAKAREEQETLNARVEKLEAALNKDKKG